ncbi:MAG: hypothetical protein AAGF12_20645 [Myxococcota bacterium]
MTEEERSELIEEVAGPHRATDPRQVVFLPAWHDLDEEGREQAFELSRELRAMEAALDEEGYSGTVRAVLARIRRS